MPWDAALPKPPVAPGETWTVKGPALAALFPVLGEKPDGALAARLVGVADERLEPGAAPERVAKVGLSLRATRTDEDGARFEIRLDGTLSFALARGRVVALLLTGEGAREEDRPDAATGATMQLRGRGPLEVTKRIRFVKDEDARPASRPR